MLLLTEDSNKMLEKGLHILKLVLNQSLFVFTLLLKEKITKFNEEYWK